MATTAPPPATLNATSDHVHHHKTVLLKPLSFYWGKNAVVLFSGWPGNSTGMYVLCLIFVFVLAVLVECLSHCNLIKPGANRVAAGFFQTAIHGVRVGLSYMVILAVMSYNGGVFLAAVFGHAVGNLLFRRRVFKKDSVKPSDRPTTGS